MVLHCIIWYLMVFHCIARYCISRHIYLLYRGFCRHMVMLVTIAPILILWAGCLLWVVEGGRAPLVAVSPAFGLPLRLPPPSTRPKPVWWGRLMPEAAAVEAGPVVDAQPRPRVVWGRFAWPEGVAWVVLRPRWVFTASFFRLGAAGLSGGEGRQVRFRPLWEEKQRVALAGHEKLLALLARLS